MIAKHRAARAAAALVIVGAMAAPSAQARSWQVYLDQSFQSLEVDADSIRPAAELVYFEYRARLKNSNALDRPIRGVAACATRQRADVGTDGSFQLREVYPDTWMAKQLDAVCGLAGRSVAAAKPAMPAPAAASAAPRVYSDNIGLAARAALAPAQAPVKESKPSFERIQREIRDYFDGLVSSDDRLQAFIRENYGDDLSEAKVAVAKAYLRKLARDERYLALVAKQAHDGVQADMSMQQLRTLISLLQDRLMMRGLSRLGPERALFLGEMNQLMGSQGDEVCKALAAGKLDVRSAQRVMLRWLSTTSDEQYAEHFRMVEKSIRAEIDGYPEVPKLLPEERQLGEKVMQAALRKALRQKLDAETINNFATKGMEGDAFAVCAATKVTIQTIVELDEPYRSWMLTQFMASVAAE